MLAPGDRQVSAVEVEDDLEHAGVHALGAVTRERSLWNDQRLEANELERRFDVTVPPGEPLGRRAGVKTCAVLWGYGDREEMARWEPDYWIDDPAEW